MSILDPILPIRKMTYEYLDVQWFAFQLRSSRLSCAHTMHEVELGCTNSPKNLGLTFVFAILSKIGCSLPSRATIGRRVSDVVQRLVDYGKPQSSGQHAARVSVNPRPRLQSTRQLPTHGGRKGDLVVVAGSRG